MQFDWADSRSFPSADLSVSSLQFNAALGSIATMLVPRIPHVAAEGADDMQNGIELDNEGEISNTAVYES